MNLHNGSAFGMSVCFDARRAENMTTGEYMLWSFKETAPADTAILKGIGFSYLFWVVVKLLDVIAMDSDRSNLLKLSLGNTIDQLAQKMF